ncbi:MAG: hypothetical protein H7328_13245 [Bdellovibrio sp.]|nr:hypothetical protein [Bdellovibrio sp.]
MMRRFYLLINFCAFLVSLQSKAAEEKKAGTAPTYRISANALLLSQFVDRGLAISDKNPALNASFLFNFGSQFKLGFWGSNISHVSAADDNFWFKLLAEIKIDFSDKSAVKLYLHDDKYYKLNIRNGQRAGLLLNYNLWNAQAEWMSNYEGTSTFAQYLNVGKAYIFKQDYSLGAKLGYVMQTAPGLENYFDLKAYVDYQMTLNSRLELGGTMVSNNSQFGNRGDPAVFGLLELVF